MPPDLVSDVEGQQQSADRDQQSHQIDAVDNDPLNEEVAPLPRVNLGIHPLTVPTTEARRFGQLPPEDFCPGGKRKEPGFRGRQVGIIAMTPGPRCCSPHDERAGWTYPPWVVRDEEDRIVGEDWLGTPDAAKYLGVRVPTLYRLIDEGLVPAYKIGRVIRIQVSDLDAFIKSARIEPGTITHLYPWRDLDDVG